MSTTNGIKQGAEKGEASDKMKFCHPSVCVGGAQPISCVCPTKPKK